MNTHPMTTQARGQFELRFRSLFDPHRGFAFPCDFEGRVNIDALSDRARINYFYARALVGRDLTTPDVEPVVATN